MELKEFTEAELTPEIATGIATIAFRSFESSKTLDQRIAEMLNKQVVTNSLEYTTTRRFVVIADDGNVVAHAKTFVREVKAESGNAFPVLALATVCSDPDVRGKGFGAQVTRKAFDQVGQDPWPSVSLFQTPVPGFYEKLNCRIAKNHFVDRTNSEAPDAWVWRDDIAMIYPAEAEWPDGVIDINGPDY